MKAMILAAGFGSRLQELTKDRPKCLVEVGGKPMLHHVIDRLKQIGVSEVIINLHYLGDMIVSFMEANSNFGLRVHFRDEREILGTGGGVGNCADLLFGSDPVVIHNCDIYSEIDLVAAIEAHKRAGANATLLVMNRSSHRRLLFDADGQLSGWENLKTQARQLIDPNLVPVSSFSFSGIQIVDSLVLSQLHSRSGEFSLIDGYFDCVRNGLKVGHFDCGDSYWADMGSKDKLAELESYLMS